MAWDLGIWAFYLEVISRQMGYPLMAIFVITLFLYIFKKDRFNWILLAWAILPIIVFTFVNNKGARYTMPSLPAMALITAVVLTQIKNISPRKFLYSITGITTLLTILYNGFIPKPAFLPYLGQANLPFTQLWPINAILDDIIEEAKPEKQEQIIVRTLANYQLFSKRSIQRFCGFSRFAYCNEGRKKKCGRDDRFFYHPVWRF